VGLGAALGAVFGIANLILTAVDPLSDDSVTALLLFYGPMFVLFGATGLVAYRRTGRLLEALKEGAVVGAATLAVFEVGALLRVNLFLEAIRHRADWERLTSEFHRSGTDNLRAYVNASYLKQAPLKIFAGTVLGTTFATLGGLLGKLGPARKPGLPSEAGA
jgi:hypothetical protein